MKNTYIQDWNRTKQRFTAWWQHEPIGHPLMRVIAEGKPANGLADIEPFTSVEDMYFNVKKIVEHHRNGFKSLWYLEDSFPSVGLNLGAGSMALYLGTTPIFTPETVWFHESITDWAAYPGIKFDPLNQWWVKHLQMIKEAQTLADGDFLVDIPDIVENMDILSALRGPLELCYDIVDEPEIIQKALDDIEGLYFTYYDAIYDIVKGADGSSSFTAFNVWGPGKTAKIQCDFNVLMSPDQFREIAVPRFTVQCQRLDNSIFHLDGPDAIKHVPALMEIEELNALQWTCGAGQPDGGAEKWHPIYDQVKEAGKGLWIYLDDGNQKDCVEAAVRLIKRYGADLFYFNFLNHFPDKKSAEEAGELIRKTSK